MIRRFSQLLALAIVCSFVLAASAAEPLHMRIDKLIDATNIGPHSPRVDDSEFLRRISLHLKGIVPSSDEARAFLDDKAPDKRAKLIDQLLSGPQYARHMANVFSVMLMERRSNAADWLAFLKSSLEQNKPWTEIAAAMIATDGVDPKTRGPVNFYLARSVETNLMTREVGRLFFGKDMQCAQCHNHPLIDDYLQIDYYGIYAFLNRTYQFKPDKKKPAVLADKPDGDVNFKSVFTGFEGKTRPRLLGEKEIEEPTFKKGEEYEVKPDKKKKDLRPVPKYSRRLKFAELIKQGSNKDFRRNIANRLWAHMMGRGLVEPVDLHHSDNPPSHPELLDLLAEEFAAMNFDIREFLRQLALTKTYQQSITLPDKLVETSNNMAARLVELEQELKKLTATLDAADEQISKIDDQLDAANKVKAPIDEELAKANAARTEAQKTHAANAKKLSELQKQLSTRQEIAKYLAEAASKASAAAKLLPDDKELSQVVTSLEARSTKLAGEVMALSKTTSEHQAKAKETGDKLAAADTSVKEIQKRRDTEFKKIDEIRRQLAAMQETRKPQILAATVAQRRVSTVKSFIDYGGKLATTNSVKGEADKAIAEASVPQQAADQARATLAQAKQELPTATKASEAAVKLMAETKKQLSEKPAVAQAVAGLISQLSTARAKLPEDPELKAIAELLKAKSAKLASEIQSLNKAFPERESAVQSTAERLNTAQEAQTTAIAAFAEADKNLAPLAKKRAEANAKLDKAQAALDEIYNKLTKFWSQQFVIRPLKPLSPEQMAWSIMKVSGQNEKQRAASAAEINKKTPLKPEEHKDPAKVAAREKQIDEATYKKLQGNVAPFVKLFAASAGQPQDDFFSTFDQALYFANAGTVRGWIAPGSGNLAERLGKQDNLKQLAEELYLSVLTRRPTEEETAEVEKYLAARPKEKAAAVQEYMWALITSTEFRFNH